MQKSRLNTLPTPMCMTGETTESIREGEGDTETLGEADITTKIGWEDETTPAKTTPDSTET